MAKNLVATRLEAPTYNALTALACQQERTLAFLLRKAAEQYVESEQKGGRMKRQLATV